MRVEATPQEGNHEAHADIYSFTLALSKTAQKNVFRLLREALADLARWETGFGPKVTVLLYGTSSLRIRAPFPADRA